MKLSKAISVKQLFNTNIQSLAFTGDWLNAIGQPEPSGSWLIWGQPGNGKTRFALQLAKYLAQLGKRVGYDSLEEGVSLSLRLAIADTGLMDVHRRFILLDKEGVQELSARLTRKKSPDVVIIDSVQYTGMSYSDYKELKDRHRNKLFILISHADGSQPAGRVARSIRYDASVKIWVDGYTAHVSSRFGGGTPYVIWEDGVRKYLMPKEV